jgi:uncharacterized protein HemX
VTTRTAQPPPKRRRRLPTRPPSGGTPLLRLAALIVGAILIAVVLVLWISSCRDDQRTGQYRDYMTNVGRIAATSQQVGQDLNALIFSSGIQVEDLQNQLEGLRQAQTQAVRQAEELRPPGPLREQHEELVESMQLRVSGLNGLERGPAASLVSTRRCGIDAIRARGRPTAASRLEECNAIGIV